MKIKFLFIFIFFAGTFFSNSQETLAELLHRNSIKSVPYISVQELAMPKTKAFILDAREPAEYKVSHIKDALNVGFDDFNIKSVFDTIKNKDTTVVVYCSIGLRSEMIAEQIKKAGYSDVYNLYGGIFEWKNKGFKVYDVNVKETQRVHAFSKEWSKWLVKGEKVYE